MKAAVQAMSEAAGTTEGNNAAATTKIQVSEAME